MDINIIFAYFQIRRYNCMYDSIIYLSLSFYLFVVFDDLEKSLELSLLV